MKKLFLVLAVSLMLLSAWCAGSAAASAAPDEISALIEGFTAFRKAESGAESLQEWVSGPLAASAGSSADWIIIALSRTDPELDLSAYADALEVFLRENKVSSASSRQRFALVLTACGRSESEFVRGIPDETIGKQGIMSWIFGLHLLNNGIPAERFTAGDAAGHLLDLQLTDGGWALTGGHADVDVTAMVIQALAPYTDASEEIRSAVDAALECLSARQMEDGGYQGFGAPNAESCAQVLTALTSAGVDPLTDERFIKNGHSVPDALKQYRLPDGNFSHEAGGEGNDTAAVQAYYSLVSADLFYSGKGRLFVFDENALPLDAVREIPHAAEIPTEEKPVQPAAQPAAPEKQSGGGYKPMACAVIAGLTLLSALILFLRGKRNFRNYLFLLICGAILAAVILLTDIQKPQDYYSAVPEKPDAVGKVTLTIRCDTVAGKTELETIPADGVILPATEFSLNEGETVYDILIEAAKAFGIRVENDNSSGGAYGMAYISGIHDLYEFDFGDLSGWVYHVNGEEPSVGCGEYKLSDGDRIEWLYTLDLGRDVKQQSF